MLNQASLTVNPPVGFDFMVVGGGVLGLCVTALAAGMGYRVLMVRCHDRERPRADTLRNQSWLQSGILYSSGDFSDKRHRRRVAKATYSAGRTMLKTLDLHIPDEAAGLVRVSKKGRIDTIRARARDLGIPQSSVAVLDSSAARSLLGCLYEDDSLYLTLPDIPFDEAAVMRRLRSKARKHGATFVELVTPLTLQLDSDGPSGFCVSFGESKICPGVALLAAGAGNLPLLSGIKVRPPLALRQTPLLVLHEKLAFRAPILVDYDRGYSIVRQPPELAPPHGAVIVGTRVRRPTSFVEPESRKICRAEVLEFRKHLPPALRRLEPRGRFTAGVEVVPTSPRTHSYLEPWLDAHLPGLVVATPGRATLALNASYQALNLILEKLDYLRRNGYTGFLADPSDWTAEIRMHFDPSYSFDDAQRGAS